MKVRKHKDKRWTSIGACALAGAVALVAPAYADDTQTQSAQAQDQGTQQLESIVVQGQNTGTASYEAPTQGTLDAGEPQSVIGQHYIENNVTPAENYSDIVNIAPSVSEVTPNGPGNAETLQMSIRGFQDGQFNVTFDGIPFQDSNDFTHHSTSYFTADTIGNILVDRGPGTASQLGYATFGGTVAIQSKDPMETSNLNATAMFGTWDTNDLSAEADTGKLANGGRLMVTLTDLNTAGAMTYNAQRRKNAFIKYVQPVSPDTTITAVAMYNTVHQNVSGSGAGATMANINAFGPHYSLTNNPSSDSYYGYNFDNIHSDIEYLGVKTNLGAVQIDNKVYTYSYMHQINGTNDPNLPYAAAGYPSAGSLGAYDGLATTNPLYNNVAGQIGAMDYRSWGDTLRAEGKIGKGTLRGGLWLDYQWNYRFLQDVNWTLGGTPDASGPDGPNGIQRNLRDDMTTIMPFVEYEYHPTDAWTITPGLRYSSFKRSISGDEIPSLTHAYPGLSSYSGSMSNTYNGAQPSIYANYRLAPNASVYAQWARGFLAPKDASVFYNVASQVGVGKTLPPVGAETTNNLQAGTTWKFNRFTVAGDVYYIKANNFVQMNGSGTNVSQTGNGAFKGVELEGTYAFGAGVSLYGNASFNHQTIDGAPMQFAPDKTAALGLIYDRHGLYASLIDKYVGSEYQGAGTSDPLNPAPFAQVQCGGGAMCYHVGGYSITNLSLAYTIANPAAGLKDVKVRLDVSDLFNNQSLYYTTGGAAIIGYDTFMALPGRAYTLGVSADF